MNTYQNPEENNDKKILIKKNWLSALGKKTVLLYIQILLYLSFVGETSVIFAKTFFRSPKILMKQVAQNIEFCGVRAMPIIGLLSFLVGIVLAYQMGDQLKNYGATIFVVNLLGLSLLREFAPLMTAIILAGRTGSAFTAELGTMKVTQEIDALTTMGVSPIAFLILPKIIGLIITLPFLSMWAAFTGLLGGMIMSKTLLGITPSSFMAQLESAITVKQIFIGLAKTPIFAFIISSIGCFQGLQVKGSAESIGQQTTISVVQSLFLIIVADAGFSILLSIFHA